MVRWSMVGKSGDGENSLGGKPLASARKKAAWICQPLAMATASVSSGMFLEEVAPGIPDNIKQSDDNGNTIIPSAKFSGVKGNNVDLAVNIAGQSDVTSVPADTGNLYTRHQRLCKSGNNFSMAGGRSRGSRSARPLVLAPKSCACSRNAGSRAIVNATNTTSHARDSKDSGSFPDPTVLPRTGVIIPSISAKYLSTLIGSVRLSSRLKSFIKGSALGVERRIICFRTSKTWNGPSFIPVAVKCLR